MTGGETRAQHVLRLVLVGLPQLDPPTTLLDSWTEAPDTFCLVYHQQSYDWPLGLRRVVEPDWTIEGVVYEVLTCEIGEPLGSLIRALQPDERGVRWWSGNPPDWKGPAR